MATSEVFKFSECRTYYFTARPLTQLHDEVEPGAAPLPRVGQPRLQHVGHEPPARVVRDGVADLLGQLLFLGVDPYADRGSNGDAFWEREVSARWKRRDPDALEVVHDLLGQIMMRHSKAQCDQSGEAIVEMLEHAGAAGAAGPEDPLYSHAPPAAQKRAEGPDVPPAASAGSSHDSTGAALSTGTSASAGA